MQFDIFHLKMCLNYHVYVIVGNSKAYLQTLAQATWHERHEACIKINENCAFVFYFNFLFF